MRDNDYAHTCVRRRNDPFLVTSKRKVDAMVLRGTLSKVHPTLRSEHLTKMKLLKPLEPVNQPIGGTRLGAFKEARWKRILSNAGMAAIGGGFLIAPMWLMVLRNTIYTTLVTTTLCVALFGMIMSWRLSGPMEVLSATAAYAAVLVVFVGTNTAGGNLGGN